jgi:hypothetical protein
MGCFCSRTSITLPLPRRPAVPLRPFSMALDRRASRYSRRSLDAGTLAALMRTLQVFPVGRVGRVGGVSPRRLSPPLICPQFT